MTEVSHVQRRNQTAVAVVLALLCALLALQLAARWGDERNLRRANEAGAAGRLDEARRLAAEITDGTAAADAWYVRANAAAAQSRFADAQRGLREVLRRRPNDWRARRDLASVLLLLGRRDLARGEYERALGLNPRMPPLLAFGAAESADR